MVAVKPVQSDREIAEIFDEHGVVLCDGAMAMIAVEKEKKVGSAAFQLLDGELTLLSVHYPKNDLYLCDLISRGAMNYGVNRGVLYCNLGEQAPKDEFVKFGFIKDLSETSVNIIRVFTMCTHCKKAENPS